MKRVISLFLVLFLAFVSIPFPCNAASQENTEILYFEDGGYLVITTTASPVSRASSTISGHKDAKRYDANNVLQWTYTLNGTFSYTPGVSATCTSASCSVSIVDTQWSCSTKSATPSGATAIGAATMIKKVFFITTNTVPVNITLACDTNGNLS